MGKTGSAPSSDQGAIVHELDFAPDFLPPVRSRDIEMAWDKARQAAQCAACGHGRAFRFRDARGAPIDLMLRDPDARCWANAVDRTIGLQTSYGLAVCVRLLALIDLLARSPALRALLILEPGGAVLPAPLLRLAAQAKLTDDAGFDDLMFRNQLLPASAKGSYR